MNDLESTFVLFLEFGGTGLVGGWLLKKCADGIVAMMMAMQSSSPHLNALKEMSRRQREGIRRFRERSASQARKVAEAQNWLSRQDQAKRAAEVELAKVRQRPDNNWRMLGDERSGTKAYAAEVFNAAMARGDAEKVGIGRFWPREWTHPVLVVVWANSRAEARQRLESTYAHSEGFTISTMHEFKGAATDVAIAG